MVDVCITCMVVPILAVISIIYLILECLGLKSKSNPTEPNRNEGSDNPTTKEQAEPTTSKVKEE